VCEQGANHLAWLENIGEGDQGGTFGYVTKAADPRIGQIAAKFRF